MRALQALHSPPEVARAEGAEGARGARGLARLRVAGGARWRVAGGAGGSAPRVVPLPRCPRPRRRQRRPAGGGSNAELNMQQISSHSDWSKDGFR